MYVVAISRTGHATTYGPFDHIILAAQWSDQNLPGWDRHDTMKTTDPRGTVQFVHAPIAPSAV